ncbi:hypothetical protein ASPVEDRAFT_531303 [Aspergillus versicolor CBS 583.65]|uniref:Uncharacterized protein n=1 Tax=Aspergillus versicolor CBS 583.65 TaxID=1036611 RepID=A0A1L9PEJ4_ASPVE|nr:uncharacterized protein ASPVEDRAFT_531303 [Aspergillus versicolor CBS 583.65]OJI99901.1 hypothetical protein ASPVEDRAFT_531303 [Aspergillus versicolor CBS 583.65]
MDVMSLLCFPAVHSCRVLANHRPAIAWAFVICGAVGRNRRNEGPSCAPLCPVWAIWGLRRQRQKTRTAGSTRVFFFLFFGLRAHTTSRSTTSQSMSLSSLALQCIHYSAP